MFSIRISTAGASISSPELVVNPFVTHLAVPIRLPMSEGLALTIAPAGLMGMTTGHLDFGAQGREFSPGFGGMTSVDLFFGGLGLMVETGLRVLKADIVWADESSYTGYKQPTLGDRTLVKVHFGGTYGAAGLLLRF